MELMDTSLDKVYRFVCEHLKSRIPEPILGKITVSVSNNYYNFNNWQWRNDRAQFPEAVKQKILLDNCYAQIKWGTSHNDANLM